MKNVEVVAAIIQHENKVLCVQRGPAKYDYIHHKFEFPGGKIESSETSEQALRRELVEELHIEVSNLQYFMTVEHSYPDFNLIMHAFTCDISSRDIVLTEHIDAKWLGTDELEELDWAAADIPIVQKLQNDHK